MKKRNLLKLRIKYNNVNPSMYLLTKHIIRTCPFHSKF